MLERRRHQREILSKTVTIPCWVVREGRPNLRCTLVDISEAGARLMIEKPSDLADRFTIAMTERGIPQRQCKLVWRGKNDVGVAFESPNFDRKKWDRELAPGNTLDDALDTFALRP
jgi:hypothetical protein